MHIIKYICMLNTAVSTEALRSCKVWGVQDFGLRGIVICEGSNRVLWDSVLAEFLWGFGVSRFHKASATFAVGLRLRV